MNQKKTATERTFQGILISLINQILTSNTEIGFQKITQEENVGVDNNRFSDGLLYSRINSNKNVFIELKDTSWDATDEILVKDAMYKANNKGIEYFVTRPHRGSSSLQQPTYCQPGKRPGYAVSSRCREDVE